MNHTLIEHLSWRYATKRFAPGIHAPESALEAMREAVRLTATSYGLQLYHVLEIHDAHLRKALVPASYGQNQVQDAGDLWVFCIPTGDIEYEVRNSIREKADLLGKPVEDFERYQEFVLQDLRNRTEEDRKVWLAKQTYIALGNALASAAEQRVDTCPMEGFDPERYMEILSLRQKGLRPTLVLPIGVRSPDDLAARAKKFRKAQSSIFQSV